MRTKLASGCIRIGVFWGLKPAIRGGQIQSIGLLPDRQPTPRPPGKFLCTRRVRKQPNPYPPRSRPKPTENEFAIRAFISTFTSPKASKMSYDEMLETIRDRNESLRVGLVYGREDPWVVPLWGQRLKRVIKKL